MSWVDSGAMLRGATHRLFFAVWPDAAMRTRLEALKARLGEGYAARWVRPARWHLTLCFLGASNEFREGVVECAVRAADGVRAPAFAWRPDRVDGFRGSRPPCVLCASRPCGPLQDLHRRLVEALFGEQVEVSDKRRYVPHVTLGYAHGRAIDGMNLSPLDFAVRDFVLLHSVSGESVYQELGRWSLDPMP